MFKYLFCLIFVLASVSALAAQPPPVLDRELFFGNPEIAGSQLSPDGKYISFIKPLNGVRNIFVKGASEPFSAARAGSALTFAAQKRITRFLVEVFQFSRRLRAALDDLGHFALGVFVDIEVLEQLGRVNLQIRSVERLDRSHGVRRQLAFAGSLDELNSAVVAAIA